MNLVFWIIASKSLATTFAIELTWQTLEKYFSKDHLFADIESLMCLLCISSLIYIFCISSLANNGQRRFVFWTERALLVIFLLIPSQKSPIIWFCYSFQAEVLMTPAGSLITDKSPFFSPKKYPLM